MTLLRSAPFRAMLIWLAACSPRGSAVEWSATSDGSAREFTADASVASEGDQSGAVPQGGAPCVRAQGSFGPPLPGPYCVGQQRVHWTDSARLDPFDLNGQRDREVAVTFHYPASVGDADVAAPYGSVEVWGVTYSEVLAPEMVSAAVLDVPALPTKAGFPLLVYSPGFGVGLSETNTLLFQTLASHGYVVAAVDHPHVSHAVRREDGSIVRFGDGKQALAMPAEVTELDPMQQDPMPVTGATQAMGEGVYAFPVVVADLGFVLDEVLTASQGTETWRDRIDPSRIGAFGHSYGGAAAAELLRADERVLAAVNYDGRFHTDVLQQGVDGPLLLIAIEGRITGDPPPNSNYGYRQGLSTASPGYYAEVIGGVHSMFQLDLGVLRKLRSGRSDPRYSGALDADRALAACSGLTLAFFEAHLRGVPGPGTAQRRVAVSVDAYPAFLFGQAD